MNTLLMIGIFIAGYLLGKLVTHLEWKHKVIEHLKHEQRQDEVKFCGFTRID